MRVESGLGASGVPHIGNYSDAARAYGIKLALESRGRIYTTSALEYFPARHAIRYSCDGMELRGETLKGCGHRGEVDVFSGDGKLSWKVEFAARWSALKINYEAYGKELIDSVKTNVRVMEEVLGEPPPFHTRYEHFLDKTGAKVSKSVGNVLAPQLWLRYAPPQTLLLLMYKRSVGSRAVWVKDIPTYIAELDELEDVYFGRKEVKDPKELARLRGLYEYVWHLSPPRSPTAHVPQYLLVYLVKVAPKGNEKEFIDQRLTGYGYQVDSNDQRFRERRERRSNKMDALATQELRIRKFESQDLTGISEIEQLSFKDPFPSYFLSQLAEANPDTFLVAVRSDRIVGYAVIDRWPDQEHLVSIAVIPESRKTGVGQALLDHLIRNMQTGSLKRTALLQRSLPFILPISTGRSQP